MRVAIDEDYIVDKALAWWRGLTPRQRAIFIQALWECDNGQHADV